MRSVADARQLDSASPSASRSWGAAALLAASLAGFALLATIALAGPTTLAGMRPAWLALFLACLAGASLWWGLYLWLLGRFGDLSFSEGLNRSVVPAALLSLSLVPDLAVFLAGKLPYLLPFDAHVRSLYLWITASQVCLVLAAQELVVAAAARRQGVPALFLGWLRGLAALPGWVLRLPGFALAKTRDHPLLTAIMAVGIVQRLLILDVAHAGDMNDILSVVFSLLRWPPFGYYHDYRPQTYVYAHLPLYPALIAPFYWLFENVAKLPTPWAAKLVSVVADLAIAVMIYSQGRGWWKGRGGTLLAAVWLLTPWIALSDDHAVGTAAAFTIAAFTCLKRSWLCGALIGLGVAARTEVAFLSLPLVVHFAARRELREKVSLLAGLSTVLVAVTMPFVLTDLEAMDWAMRLQAQRQAAGEASRILLFLQPVLTPGLVLLFQRDPSLITLLATASTSLLALRDPRVMRVILVVGLVYLQAIPIVHPRYTVFAYALGLFYAARHRNQLLAAAIAVGLWPETPWDAAAQASVAAALALFSVLQIDRPEKWKI